jgi:hypothetical protein
VNGGSRGRSRCPPISLDTMVPRTGGYTYGVGVWGLSIAQGPFSVAPCKPNVTIRNFCIAVRRRGCLPRSHLLPFVLELLALHLELPPLPLQPQPLLLRLALQPAALSLVPRRHGPRVVRPASVCRGGGSLLLLLLLLLRLGHVGHGAPQPAPAAACVREQDALMYDAGCMRDVRCRMHEG